MHFSKMKAWALAGVFSRRSSPARLRARGAVQGQYSYLRTQLAEPLRRRDDARQQHLYGRLQGLAADLERPRQDLDPAHCEGTPKAPTCSRIATSTRSGSPRRQDRLDRRRRRHRPEDRRRRATWTQQDSGTTKNLFNVFAIDDQQVAVGADGTIIRTADGGAHWQTVKSPKIVSLFRRHLSR